MKIVKLECLLMDNNEIMFHGRSLGFLKTENVDNHNNEMKFVEVVQDLG